MNYDFRADATHSPIWAFLCENCDSLENSFDPEHERNQGSGRGWAQNQGDSRRTSIISARIQGGRLMFGIFKLCADGKICADRQRTPCENQGHAIAIFSRWIRVHDGL